MPNFRDVSRTVEYWRLMGYTTDPRIEKCNLYQRMTFGHIYSFYATAMKGRPHIISVTGNTKKFDKRELENFGEVEEVKLKDMYRK